MHETCISPRDALNLQWLQAKAAAPGGDKSTEVEGRLLLETKQGPHQQTR